MTLLVLLASMLVDHPSPDFWCPVPGKTEMQYSACPNPPPVKIRVFENGQWVERLEYSMSTNAVACFKYVCVDRSKQ